MYHRRERPTAWVPGASRRLEEAFVLGVAEGGPAATAALAQAQAAAAAAADLAIDGAGPEAQELLDGASAEARALLVRYAPEVQAAARAAQAQAPGVQAAVLTAGSQLLDSLSALTPTPRPGVEPFDGSTAWPRERERASLPGAAHAAIRRPRSPARLLGATLLGPGGGEPSPRRCRGEAGAAALWCLPQSRPMSPPPSDHVGTLSIGSIRLRAGMPLTELSPQLPRLSEEMMRLGQELQV